MLKRSEEARFMPDVWVFPGGSVDAEDGEGEAGYRACAVRELAEEAAIELPADEELVPFSRWITPEVISTRFDAWFFLALAPAHTPPKPDGVETIEAALVRARRRAGGAGGGRARPRLPDRQPSSQWLLPVPHLRRGARRPPRAATVEPILPKVVGTRREPPGRPPRRPRLPRLRLVRRERLQAGVPGAGRVGVDAALVHLALQPLEQLAGVLQRRLQLLARCARRSRQRNQSWRSLTPKSISPVIVVTQPRKPGLNSSRSATGSYSFGTVGQEALVEVDRLELDLAREALGERLVRPRSTRR